MWVLGCTGSRGFRPRAIHGSPPAGAGRPYNSVRAAVIRRVGLAWFAEEDPWSFGGAASSPVRTPRRRGPPKGRARPAVALGRQTGLSRPAPRPRPSPITTPPRVGCGVCAFPGLPPQGYSWVAPSGGWTPMGRQAGLTPLPRGSSGLSERQRDGGWQPAACSGRRGRALTALRQAQGGWLNQPQGRALRPARTRTTTTPRSPATAAPPRVGAEAKRGERRWEVVRRDPLEACREGRGLRTAEIANKMIPRARLNASGA